MITLRIPLSEIVVDPQQEADLTELSHPEAIDRLRELYAFLGTDSDITIENGTAVIQLEAPSSTDSQVRKMREKAVAAANRGRYSQAAQLYQRLVDQRPHDPDARRELGMSYLEMGEVDPAEQHVLEALRLDPQDAYAHLLLGNIYLEHRQNTAVAERFYRRAAAIKPDDPYLLSNYGGLLARQGDYENARANFEQAIAAAPGYPNAYFNLAVMVYNQGQAEEAIAVLDRLFAQPESVDIRSEPVYEEAWRLYREANLSLARQRQEEMMTYVRARRDALEQETGVEIELVQDAGLGVAAKAEVAWHHGRTSHVVRYRLIGSHHHAAPHRPRAGAHRHGAGGARRRPQPLLHHQLGDAGAGAAHD